MYKRLPDNDIQFMRSYNKHVVIHHFRFTFLEEKNASSLSRPPEATKPTIFRLLTNLVAVGPNGYFKSPKTVLFSGPLCIPIGCWQRRLKMHFRTMDLQVRVCIFEAIFTEATVLYGNIFGAKTCI